MAKNKKKTQEYLLMHSRAKVNLLGTYLDLFLNVLSRSGHLDRINIFDLFSAEGIYKNEGKGSPIVVLEKMKTLYELNTKNQKKQPVLVFYQRIAMMF